MPSPVYFPDSRVASRAIALSPVTQPDLERGPMHGPPDPIFWQTPPDFERPGDEQGIGRSPGQRWPHHPHVEQYSFDSLAGIGWHGTDEPRPERAGWSAPVYYEQLTDQHHLWPVPMVVEAAPSMSYTQLGSGGNA
jgi:hypothetical protein